MTNRLGPPAPLLTRDSLSFDMEDIHDDLFYEEQERIDEINPPLPLHRHDTMFTSLCAVFSNGLNPVVPQRHSSRWRIGISIVIGIMTFTASFAHLRSMMHNNVRDRRAQERHVMKSLQSLRFFGGNPVQAPTQLQTTTEKEDVPTNPRVLLGMTVTCWSFWLLLVATHPYVKRRMVVVGEGSERSIATCIVFILACILTHWTRIRYGEADMDTVK